MPLKIDISTVDGVNWGAKIQAAHDLLPSTGGVIDAHKLTGAQSMTEDINISKHDVAILIGSARIAAGSSRIIVAGGTLGFQALGPAVWAATTDFAAQTGAVFDYSGSADFWTIGNASVDTHFMRLSNIAVQLHNAGGAARGIVLKRTQLFDLVFVNVGCSTNADSRVGVVLDGTGSYTGTGHMLLRATNLATGVLLTGSGANGANDVEFAAGGGIAGCVTAVSVVAGQGNRFVGNYEANTKAFLLGADAIFNQGTVRCEGNTADFDFAAGSVDNDFTATSGSGGNNQPIITGAAAGVNIVRCAGRTYGPTQFDGRILTVTDDLHDLGAAGAQRFRSAYLSAFLDAGVSVKVAGTKVLGAQGAALPTDATDLGSALTLVNAIKARMKATGGHGLVAD